MTDPATLTRIAAALERMAPPPPPAADPAAHPAYVWREGVLVATRAFRPLALDLLTGVEAQKAAILQNAARLADRLPAHDVLLWGARGTGKSSLVKSVVGALQAGGRDIALVEVAPDALTVKRRHRERLAGEEPSDRRIGLEQTPHGRVMPNAPEALRGERACNVDPLRDRAAVHAKAAGHARPRERMPLQVEEMIVERRPRIVLGHDVHRLARVQKVEGERQHASGALQLEVQGRRAAERGQQ